MHIINIKILKNQYWITSGKYNFHVCSHATVANKEDNISNHNNNVVMMMMMIMMMLTTMTMKTTTMMVMVMVNYDR